MATSGGIPMVNVHNKAELIILSTDQGTQNDSTNSDVLWPMQDYVGKNDDNITAMVSLNSMAFFNTFDNISKANNKLKVLSWYLDGANETVDIQDVAVPPGHYSITALLDYLNADGVCNDLVPNPGGFYYGLGVYGDATYPPFYTATSNPSKLRLQPPTAGAAPGVLGMAVSSHIYLGFYLIIDDETYPLMKTLGLIFANQSGQTTSARLINAAGISYQVIGFDVYNGGPTQFYTYAPLPYVNPTALNTTSYLSANVINLGGPSAINISMENIGVNIRNSANQLAKGNIIAVVPVTAAYGYRNVYEPSNAFKCAVPGLSLTEFHLIVKSADTGERVDFQGQGWMCSLVIEYFEIDTTHHSLKAQEGNHLTNHSNYQTTVQDHNLPFSGGKTKRSREGELRAGPGHHYAKV